MPRKQTTQFGIVFGTIRNSEGYEWFKILDHELGEDKEVLAPRGMYLRHHELGEDKEVLAPRGMYLRPNQGTFSVKGGLATSEHRLGRDRALSVVRAFVKLAREIQATQTQEQYDRGKILIVEFANEFGSLWGSNDHQSYKEWSKEAREFLDMYEIHRRLRDRRWWTLQDRFIDADDDWPEVRFRGQSGALYAVASRGEMAETRESEDDEPEIIDYFERASSGSTASKLQMVLAKQVNKKLSSGLSFSASATNTMRAIVAPSRLVHLLWLKLYLMTIDGESLERENLCLWCGKEIEGTVRREYCDSKCRSRHYRRKNGG